MIDTLFNVYHFGVKCRNKNARTVNITKQESCTKKDTVTENVTSYTWMHCHFHTPLQSRSHSRFVAFLPLSAIFRENTTQPLQSDGQNLFIRVCYNVIIRQWFIVEKFNKHRQTFDVTFLYTSMYIGLLLSFGKVSQVLVKRITKKKNGKETIIRKEN